MDRSALARLFRILWPFAALWLLLAGSVLLISAFEIRADRAAAIQEAREDTERFAGAVRALVSEKLQQYDQALSLLKLVQERRLTAQTLTALAETVHAGPLRSERRVDRYDREGRLVATTSADRGSVPTPIVDRRTFEEARLRSSVEVQLAMPIAGSEPGTFAIPVVKRLETAEGAFDGVLASTIDAGQLLAAIPGLAAGDRMTLGVVDRNGRVLAANASTVPDSVEPALAPGGMPQGRETEVVPLAGRPSLVTRADIPRHDLAVFAAIDEDALFAAHRRHARTTLVLACLALAAITVTILLAGRRALLEGDRHRQLERRSDEARDRERVDPLTGLANRATFDDRLRVTHAALAADGQPFVLAFIDVDRFKALNDRLGRAVGDRALKRVGRILREAVRNDDVVARLGGDEFAVLMPGSSAPAMRRVFEPLRERLNAMVGNEKWPISFSIGVVAFESAPPRTREAVNLADRMMYDVKSQGRNGVRYAIYHRGALKQDLEIAHSAA